MFVFRLSGGRFMSKYLIWVILLMFCGAMTTYSQPKQLVLNPIQHYGLEDSDDLNYLFSNVRAVVVNSKGEVFITNTSDHTIRVFNKDGEFLRKMGGKGRGPGEFMDLTSISIDAQDRVTAVDRFQDKVVRFEAYSSDFDELLLPETSLATLRMAQTLPNGHMVMVYKHTEGPNSEANMVHQVDTENEKVIGRYVDAFTYFYDHNKPIEVEMSSVSRYEATKLGSDKIALSSGNYTGTVAIFDFKTASTKLIGKQLKPFYEEFTGRNREYYESQGYSGIITISGQNGRFMYQPHGYILGLVGNSKYLLQFYAMHETNSRVTYVDIYSSDGKFIAKQSLMSSGITFFDGRYYSALPKFMDESNNLYIYESSEFPKVQVYATNLDEL